MSDEYAAILTEFGEITKLIKEKTTLKNKFYTVNKRCFDILFSALGLIVLLPLFLVIYIIMKVENKNAPVFFVQNRIGKYGKCFRIYKYRSMRVDADEYLKNNNALYRKYIENDYKLEPHEDPRITKIGKFLRKTSLDELPQLLNVLRGEMSLVGPRPIVLEEINEYKVEGKLKEFLLMKPGITGVWQTSGRSNIGYPERVHLEISYLENNSITFDLIVIFKTFIKVILRDGAY